MTALCSEEEPQPDTIRQIPNSTMLSSDESTAQTPSSSALLSDVEDGEMREDAREERRVSVSEEIREEAREEDDTAPTPATHSAVGGLHSLHTLQAAMFRMYLLDFTPLPALPATGAAPHNTDGSPRDGGESEGDGDESGSDDEGEVAGIDIPGAGSAPPPRLESPYPGEVEYGSDALGDMYGSPTSLLDVELYLDAFHDLPGLVSDSDFEGDDWEP